MLTDGVGLRVLFAPAAGAHIGGGHIMRDLALAQALHARGAASVFAVPPWGERLVERFAETPASAHPLDRSGEPALIALAVEAVHPDVLVLDDYGLEAAATAPLRRPGLSLAVVDDLADRSYACDLLADPGYARAAGDYASRTPQGCEVLAGPRYALLRPGFARSDISPGPDCDRPVQRVFVSFGLSDVGAVAARAVERLRPRAPRARFDVALAGDAASLPRLRALAAADPGLRVHADVRDVARLMREADVAIGAGGSATWERCALGLPSLAVVVADNQRAMIGRLAQAGAVLAVELGAPDFEAQLDTAFDRLCAPATRRALVQASSPLCDGHGSVRVADALIRLVRRRLAADGAARP